MNSAMVSSENSLQIANLSTELGWNEIEANLLGATTYITGNMPVSFIRHSLNQFQNAFQQQKPDIIEYPDDNSQISKTPKSGKATCTDKNGKVVPCNSPDRIEGGRSGISLRGILGLPDISNDASVLCSDCTEEQLEELRRTGTVASAGGSPLFKIPGFPDVDTKALVLIIIGIGLIFLAVKSL